MAPAERGAEEVAHPALDRVRRRRLRRLLLQALGAPLQRQRLARAGFASRTKLERADPEEVLRRLEPIGKSEMRAAGPAALRGGRASRWWLSSRSSGSTGEPFRVHYTLPAWWRSKIWTKWRARRACGARLRDRIAILEVMPPELEGRTWLERTGRLCRVSVFRAPREIEERLGSFDPHLVYGLPSALLELSPAREHGRLGPRLLFSSGELLTAGLRRRLETAWKCPVLDVYGTSETKEIAWECLHGSLHVNADVVWLEVLDRAGRPAPMGDEGELVATLLGNPAMPLLRYRTGDLGRALPERCACRHPFPTLGLLSGREVEVLDLGRGRRLTPYALTTALETVAGLERYQVRQLAEDRLLVRARLDSHATDATDARHAIQRALSELAAPPLHVEVDLVDRFEGGAGKFRVVEPLRR